MEENLKPKPTQAGMGSGGLSATGKGRRLNDETRVPSSQHTQLSHQMSYA